MALLRNALAAALACAGCAQGLSFNQCTTDTDCQALSSCDLAGADAGATCTSGPRLFCTSDHLCVQGVPNERLCTQLAGGDPMAMGTLVVAVLANLDKNADGSAVADQDALIAAGAKLAFDEMAMRQSGASQPPLAVVACTTSSDPDQAVKAAKRAVEFYHAVAIVGPTNSGEVIAVNAYAKSTGTLVISPSATSTEISSLQDDGLVWRTAPSDALQAQELAARIKAATSSGGQPKVDTLFDTSVYAKDLDNDFVTQYGKQLGLGFNKSYSYDPTGDPSTVHMLIDAQMNLLGKDAPTHALVVSGADAPYILSSVMAQPGLSTTQLYFSDAAKDPSLFGPANMTVDSSILARVHGTAPATPMSSTYATFRASFITTFSKDPNGTAFISNAYDAAYLVGIAAAATSGHVPSGKELASGLSRLKTSGTPVAVGPSSYLDALRQMSMGGVLLDGASGPLVFDSVGDLVAAPGQFEFWCVDTTKTPPEFTTVGCCTAKGDACPMAPGTCCSGMCDAQSMTCK